jgi:hypothetical protein
MRRKDKESSDHARQQNRSAMAAVCQISRNRREEQERARTKRKKKEEEKLLAAYAKMPKCKRLRQDWDKRKSQVSKVRFTTRNCADWQKITLTTTYL